MVVLYQAGCIGPKRKPAISEPSTPSAPCDYASGYDSLGRRCGGRAAEIIPGGELGGNGMYYDSNGNLRLRGPCNDPFDDLLSCN
jgi:hypothetical protein